MSLGGGVSTALDQAVANSIAAGVSYAIAAGNSQRQRVQHARPARVAVGDHGRSDDEHRRSLVVLELRHVRRHLRAGLEHHLVLEHERHRDEHDQRDVDGDAARGRRARALPADEPGRVAGHGDAGADRATRRRTRSRARAPARRTGCSYSIFGGGAAAGRHDAADDVDHLAGERRHRRAAPSTVAANASDNVGVSRVELFVDGVADRLRHDRRRTRSPGTRPRRRTAATGSRRRAFDAAGNVGSSAAVERHREQRRRRRRRADRQRRLRGLRRRRGRSPATAFWSTGGNHHSGTGYTILGACNNASGSEYQTVTHPGRPPGEPHVLAQHHDERVPVDRLRLRLRRGAKHVGGAARARSAASATATRRRARTRTRSGRSASRPGEGRRCGVQFRGTTDVHACRRASASTTSR